MIGYCSSLGLPISHVSLRGFITCPILCNNIQYITDVQHASRVSGWRNDCFTSSPRSLRPLGDEQNIFSQ